MLERQPAAEEHTDPRYDISRPIWFLYNLLLFISLAHCWYEPSIWTISDIHFKIRDIQTKDLYTQICQGTFRNDSGDDLWAPHLEPTCALALCCSGLCELFVDQIYSHEWWSEQFPNIPKQILVFLEWGRILIPLPPNTTPSAVSQVDMDTPLHELFGAMPWSSWDDANLGQVVVYLRGCQKLAIPPEFRPFLPREVEVNP